jgi:hypothetical protein
MIDGHTRIVSATHPSLTKYGIFAGNVRGTHHRRTAVQQGDFPPGPPARPETRTQQQARRHRRGRAGEGSSSIVGYVNKGKAARLAKLLESGEVVVAVTMDGEGPGRFTGQKIVAAAPRFWGGSSAAGNTRKKPHGN